MQVSCGHHHSPLPSPGHRRAPDPCSGASGGVRGLLPSPGCSSFPATGHVTRPFSALKSVPTAGWHLECCPKSELKEALCPHTGCPQKGVCVQPVAPAFETQARPLCTQHHCTQMGWEALRNVTKRHFSFPSKINSSDASSYA